MSISGKLTVFLGALLSATACLAAPTAVIELRECAGVARHAEPVVIPGQDLVALWGKQVDTRRITIADETGALGLVQVDEKDGGYYFLAEPNHLLDANDEVVFQASVAASGTVRYTLSVADAPPDPALLPPSNLAVGSNPDPKTSSADVLAANAFIEFGVRGWPPDPKRWGGAGTGDITTFKLGGLQQVYQGESHGWVLNNSSNYDGLFDTLEVIAGGPVRVLLQVRGPAHSGFLEGHWGRARLDATGVQPLRTYALYNDLPWLAIHDQYLMEQLNHPRVVAVTRSIWRPGGSPFDPDLKFYIPSASGSDIATIRLHDEEYGQTLTNPSEAWVLAVRPDNRPVPAFFYQPDKVQRLWGSAVEPWMRKGWEEKNNWASGKCILDVDWADTSTATTNQASWSWGVWGTDQDDPEAIRQIYRGLMLRPLTATLAVQAAEGAPRAALVDPLAIPAQAVAVLQKDVQTFADRRAVLAQFDKDFPAADEASREGLRDWVTGGSRTAQRLLDAFTKNWQNLDPKAKYDTLAEWRDWESRTPPRELWAQQFEFYQASGKAPGYRLLVTDSYHKVFSGLRVPGELNGQVEWQLARREGQSAQLALVPMMAPLNQVQVQVSDLKSPEGTLIPAEAWDLWQVGDILPPPSVNAAFHMPEGTRWPDPLLPLQPFDCPGHEARAVLATLNVPVRTAPGTYTGTLTVQPQGLAATKVPVRVKVINFTLPERRTMFWDSWYDMDTVARHYGEYADLEHYEKNMELLSKYRAVPGLYGWAAMAGKWLEVWREEDGSLTFDFSQLDQWLEIQQRYGNLWNPNGSCNSGWFSIFHSKNLWNVVKDRATGKVLTLEDLPQKSEINPKYTLIYEEFMRTYVDHLRDRGWLDSGWHEKWDEPTGDRVEMCKEHHAYLQKIVPELNLFNWGMRPVTDDWGWGFVHAWAPNLGAWYREYPGVERARREGVKVMVYTCGTSLPDLWPTVRVPDINAYDPNVQRRAYAWIYDKLKVDGLLTFTMTGWPRQTPPLPSGHNEFSTKRETRWPATDWVVNPGTTYWLVYPSPDGTMWPSLRLDALRDGFQDYEYLYAAQQLHKRNPSPELAQLLEIDDSLVLSTTQYAQDAEVYQARKLALAEHLTK
ncbi:MAG: DUF4091 domain-containing protein [candidate division WS1 bacterium]|nr:DUF4091 domain-containing protein [candidate division WS1 bacterium]